MEDTMEDTYHHALPAETLGESVPSTCLHSKNIEKQSSERQKQH